MNWPRPSSKTGLCALALSGFFCTAGMAPAADLQEIPLPMKTRVYLATIEERGLTLSNIGFPAVKNAIKSGYPTRIRAFLAEGFTDNMFTKAGRRTMENLPEDSYPPEVMKHIKRFVTGSELYLNEGGLSFRRAGHDMHVYQVGWSYGPSFVDLDNGGFQDLYATSGFMSVDNDEPDG